MTAAGGAPCPAAGEPALVGAATLAGAAAPVGGGEEGRT